MTLRNHTFYYRPQDQSVLSSLSERGKRVLSSQAASQVLIIVAILMSIILLTRG